MKWASIYGTAINRKYFRAMTMIRHHPEKRRWYKGWMTRYRKMAKRKRWEIKGKGKPMQKMIAKAIKTPPKATYQTAKTVAQIEKYKQPDEVWIWAEEEFTD